MNILHDPRMNALRITLDVKANEVARSVNLPSAKSINVRQYNDHYSFELFTADMEDSIVISINGKGLDEMKYMPDILDFIAQLCRDSIKD